MTTPNSKKYLPGNGLTQVEMFSTKSKFKLDSIRYSRYYNYLSQCISLTYAIEWTKVKLAIPLMHFLSMKINQYTQLPNVTDAQLQRQREKYYESQRKMRK